MTSPEKHISLKQRLQNQQCRTVTNNYLCQDCTLYVLKEWLKQKRDLAIAEQKEYGFDPIVPMVNVDELLSELEK